ncbi:MAG: aldose 1-epimerase family protein [Clostridia bacterium]|nr:aldose 1-epimerase family protein [Clostridia bacterium]
MLYAISNERLTVQIDSCGGELMSLRSADGTEYLWQGDPTYWKKRAPHLFPVVGRLTEGLCTLEGQPCRMDTHGFFRWREMALVSQSDKTLVLRMESDSETMAQYPRRWSFLLEYALEGNRLHQTVRVENLDGRDMWFSYGGHPGFRVPLAEGLEFEDYELCFPEERAVMAAGMSDDCFLQGEDTPLPLESGRTLPLRHSLFDRDALFLRNTPRSVTLRSGKDSHAVTVDYPELPILGVWHAPRTEAPYVCLEPWTAVPGRQGVVEELSAKPDALRLAPGAAWETTWRITCTT